MNEKYKKFIASEIIVWGSFFFGIGVICFLISLTIIGSIFVVPLQGFATFASNQIFKAKGSNISGRLGRNFAKFFSNIVPFSAFFNFLLEVFIHNHPKLAQVIGKEVGKIAGAALGGPVGEKIGGAVGQYAAGASLTESVKGAVGPIKRGTVGPIKKET